MAERMTFAASRTAYEMAAGPGQPSAAFWQGWAMKALPLGRDPLERLDIDALQSIQTAPKQCQAPSGRHHRECRLSDRLRSRPLPLSEPHHLPMNPRAQPSRHRSDRHWQVFAGLRARQQGLPRWLLAPPYERVPRLFADLAQARGEGRLARLIAALERVTLLILDDRGRSAHCRPAP